MTGQRRIDSAAEENARGEEEDLVQRFRCHVVIHTRWLEECSWKNTDLGLDNIPEEFLQKRNGYSPQPATFHFLSWSANS